MAKDVIMCERGGQKRTPNCHLASANLQRCAAIVNPSSIYSMAELTPGLTLDLQ
ncbi:MAG: hypothetical protein JO071_04235 [Deltaproteobacteria bacterium]|nr:hypothetical protein [Deltaproteobacteria bacterium]